MEKRRHRPLLLIRVNTCDNFGMSINESQSKGHAQKIDDLSCGQLVSQGCEFPVGKPIDVHSADFSGLPAIPCSLSTSLIEHQLGVNP